MEIENFTPIPALIGGILIGVATALVLLVNGKIAGISGVVARIFRAVPGDTAWRGIFLVGMVGGGTVAFLVSSTAAEFVSDAGPVRLLVAGLLVGLGTRIGGGCTSGHGVCGISRGSIPSTTATVLFIAVAIATVYVMRHVAGAGA